jgi:hypothetical protein
MQPSVPTPAFLNLDYLFSRITDFLAGFFSYIFSEQFLILLYVLAAVLVVLMIASSIYSLVRLYEIKQEQKKQAPAAVAAHAAREIAATMVGATPENIPGAMQKDNPTWNAIRAKLLSDIPSDWRLGIIEADIYLDRTLREKGWLGDTVADKLKNANQNDFPSLNLAWEAHKVRNRIAHEGADYTLTQPEARRVLSYFEIVFRDLGVIE